jgi:cytosine/adenosine deaminase-related metal-dependent hydrolase
MTTHSTNQSIAVEWACVGTEQIIEAWQEIIWDNDGRITAILPIPASKKALRKKAKGKIALPGFVNAHAHLELSTGNALPLLAEESMGDWLLSVVNASRAVEDVQAVILQGVEEALASGTTTIASTVRELSVALITLYKLPPIRSLWWLEWFHPSNDVSLEKLESLQNAYHGAIFYLNSFPDAIVNRTQLGLSPHSPYNVSLQAWQALHQGLLADEKQTIWQTHLLESTEEVAYYQKTAINPEENSIDKVHQTLLGKAFQPVLPCPEDIVASLAEFDLLQPTLSVVHGLELSIEQAEQLANSGVSLITCPRSNQFLHKKMVNELLLWHPTLSIAIGTDAHVSLPNPTVLDMRLELQALKLTYPWLTWEALLVMATLNGAKALGLAGQVGELTEGTWADIAVWQVPQQLEELSPEALLESVLNSDQKPIQVIVGGL